MVFVNDEVLVYPVTTEMFHSCVSYRYLRLSMCNTELA